MLESESQKLCYIVISFYYYYIPVFPPSALTWFRWSFYSRRIINRRTTRPAISRHRFWTIQFNSSSNSTPKATMTSKSCSISNKILPTWRKATAKVSNIRCKIDESLNYYCSKCWIGYDAQFQITFLMEFPNKQIVFNIRRFHSIKSDKESSHQHHRSRKRDLLNRVLSSSHHQSAPSESDAKSILVNISNSFYVVSLRFFFVSSPLFSSLVVMPEAVLRLNDV